MPRIPQQTRQVSPQMVEGVRVNPEAMTQESRAIAGFGQGITQAAGLGFDFATKLKDARELTEYNNTVTDTDALYNGLKESLAKDPDYTTYDKQFEETTKSAIKLGDRFTESGARTKWESYFNKTTEALRHVVSGLKNVREIKKMEGDLEANLTAAERAGDLNRAMLLLESGKMADVIDPKQAEIRKAKIEENIDFYKAQSLIQQDPGKAIDLILDTKLFPNLGEKRFSLAKTAEIALNRKTAKEKKELESAQSITQNDFVVRAFDEKKPLIDIEIDNSNLDATGAGSKYFFKNLIRERDKAIIEEKNRPYTTTNGKTLANILLENTNPDNPPMNEAKILGYVAQKEGISIQTAKDLMGTMDIRSTPIFKNTEASLKIQFGYEGILTGFGAKPLGALYYNNAMTDILTDLAKTPLKGTELRNRIYELSTPYLEEYWKAAGETQDEVDKRLKLMGVKQSPITKIIPTETKPTGKADYKYIPGQGLIKQ